MFKLEYVWVLATPYYHLIMLIMGIYIVWKVRKLK
jgi:hypothetical protein